MSAAQARPWADIAVQHDMNGAKALAFNLGSDARLAGQRISSNPYDSVFSAEFVAWRDGWRSVHREWGTLAAWPVKVLPPVTEE